uniref:Retrovirus-related Pol polyprotein from transposon TNT 1-94-like beta-barrel domain-containing protein n=1 Tax=Trichuris muris TaxID=70415 RepID=A0A5S6QKL3_TRIMR
MESTRAATEGGPQRLEKGRRPTSDEENVAAAKHVSFAIRDSPCTVDKRQWFIDSGASSHMTSDKSFFETLQVLKQQVFQADGTAVYTNGIGEGWLHCRLPEGIVQPIQLINVLYVPAVKGNLLSLLK